jgi:hypothetical protein
MPNRMSDAELLEQTAEWLSRLAETIERVTERLADSISKLQADQAMDHETLLDLVAAQRALRGAFLSHLKAEHGR